MKFIDTTEKMYGRDIMKVVQVLLIVSVIIFLMIGCSGTQTQKIEFVKNGVSQHLILSENCVPKDGYLLVNKRFSIKSDQVIYPDMRNLNFEIFSTDKNAVVKNLDIWEMKSIW